MKITWNDDYYLEEVAEERKGRGALWEGCHEPIVFDDRIGKESNDSEQKVE